MTEKIQLTLRAVSEFEKSGETICVQISLENVPPHKYECAKGIIDTLCKQLKDSL